MWHNDGYDLRSLMLGMVKMRFLLVFSIAILFSGCAVHGDMPVLSGVLTNGTYGTSASNHSRVLSNALPLTVVAAILLFLVKEIVELFKKVREKSRKISAYKGLLAEELLKNAWSLKALKRLCSELQNPELKEIEYKKSASGTERVIVRTTEGEQVVFFWKIHSAAFEKIMTDLAVSNSKLFESAAEVYSLLAEVKHVRESIIDFSEFEMPRHMVKGLGDYGNDRLSEADAAVRAAYKAYTGNELVGHKLRSYL